jgi:hypothetical protein
VAIENVEALEQMNAADVDVAAMLLMLQRRLSQTWRFCRRWGSLQIPDECRESLGLETAASARDQGSAVMLRRRRCRYRNRRLKAVVAAETHAEPLLPLKLKG